MTTFVITCHSGTLLVATYARDAKVEMPADPSQKPVLEVKPLLESDRSIAATAINLGPNDARTFTVALDRSVRVSSPTESEFRVTLLGARARLRASIGAYYGGQVVLTDPHVLSFAEPWRAKATVHDWYLLEAPLD